jgi:hypothetical protein
MNHPQRVYELLLDYANTDSLVEAVNIGLVWTVCKAGSCGLAMSPQSATRTLPWSGTLVGKPLRELCAWINDWDAHQAAVGMAAINAALNAQALPAGITLPAGNLAVFEHFLPQLHGKKWWSSDVIPIWNVTPITLIYRLSNANPMQRITLILRVNFCYLTPIGCF